MNNTHIDDMRLKPLIYRFAWIYTLCCILLAILSYLLDEYADREMPSVVAGITPLIVAIYGTAQLFGQTYARPITPYERIELAKKSTLVIFAINLILALMALAALLLSGELQIDTIHALLMRNPVMIGIAGFIILVLLLMSYTVAWMLYPTATSAFLKNSKPPQ